MVMDATASSSRQARGLALATAKAKAFRHIAGDTFFVPSQTSVGSGYVVDVQAGRCTCPDYEERGGPCKHIFALRYYRHELVMPDGTTVVTEGVRIQYPQDWPAYNRAQCEEKGTAQVLLRGLCDGIRTPPHPGRGPKPTPLSDVVFAMAMKVYGMTSGRRATTDLEASASAGHMSKAPRYNTLFDAFGKPEVTPLLKGLVNESARPLAAVERAFAVDGTGFATQTYVRWFDYKHGEDRRVQRWVKLHAMVGTLTNVITAAEVTEGTANDSPEFAGLVERTAASGFDVREVSADKAYLSHANLAVVERVGGVPFVPFKSNSASSGSEAWERMFHFFSLNRTAFLVHYHKRSNVESTFSALKRKFGENVRSKSRTAQFNEVLCKCLCFNLSMVVHAIHELGIDPQFWTPQPVNA